VTGGAVEISPSESVTAGITASEAEVTNKRLVVMAAKYG